LLKRIDRLKKYSALPEKGLVKLQTENKFYTYFKKIKAAHRRFINDSSLLGLNMNRSIFCRS
jgi:hypothetical protein